MARNCWRRKKGILKIFLVCVAVTPASARSWGPTVNKLAPVCVWAALWIKAAERLGTASLLILEGTGILCFDVIIVMVMVALVEVAEDAHKLPFVGVVVLAEAED